MRCPQIFGNFGKDYVFLYLPSTLWYHMLFHDSFHSCQFQSTLRYLLSGQFANKQIAVSQI